MKLEFFPILWLLMLSCLIQAQWVPFGQIESNIPSGFHLIDVPPNSTTLNVILDWPDAANDLDIFVYNSQSYYYVWYTYLYVASTINKPQKISKTAASFPSTICVKIDSYIQKSSTYTLTVKFNDIVIYQGTFYLFVNTISSSATSKFSIAASDLPEIGCQLRMVVNGGAQNSQLALKQNSAVQRFSVGTDSVDKEFITSINLLEKFDLVCQFPFITYFFYPMKIQLFYNTKSTQWIDDMDYCLESCSSIQNALIRSPTNFPSCICKTGYKFNQYAQRCDYSCSLFQYAKITNRNDTSCECQDGFYWNGSLCLIDCTQVEHSNGINAVNQIDQCECNFLYQWLQTPMKCAYNPSAEDQKLKIGVIVLSVVLFVLIVATIIFVIYKRKSNQEALQKSLLHRNVKKINYPDNLSFNSKSSIYSFKKQLPKLDHTPVIKNTSLNEVPEIEEPSEHEAEPDYKKSLKELSDIDSGDSN